MECNVPYPYYTPEETYVDEDGRLWASYWTLTGFLERRDEAEAKYARGSQDDDDGPWSSPQQPFPPEPPMFRRKGNWRSVHSNA